MHQTTIAIVASRTGEISNRGCYSCKMRNKSTTTDGHLKIHYIEEWAEHRALKRADIASALGVDKSLVSRWFQGAIPSDKWLEPLAELLNATEASSLFRHPDDDWIAKMFRDKTDEQREAAVEMLKLFFRNNVSAQKLNRSDSK